MRQAGVKEQQVDGVRANGTGKNGPPAACKVPQPPCRSCRAYCQNGIRWKSYSQRFSVSLSSPSGGMLTVTRRYSTPTAK